jgi:hypothetical protein
MPLVAVTHVPILLDGFKLLDVPASAAVSLSLLLIAVSLVVPLLVLAVPHRAAAAG